MPSDVAAWTLATTVPNIEFTVAERLEHRGFVHHVVRIRARRVSGA